MSHTIRIIIKIYSAYVFQKGGHDMQEWSLVLCKRMQKAAAAATAFIFKWLHKKHMACNTQSHNKHIPSIRIRFFYIKTTLF